MPQEVREKLFSVETFRQHFDKEISKLSDESKYREIIQHLLKEFFSNHDESAITSFLSKDIKQHGWEVFNHLFIRKAIDYAMDKSSNDREACSKLLQACTQKHNFQNRDFGYAFDHMIWVS